MIHYLLAAIPSPSTGSIHLGPLRLNAYGLMIGLGVVIAVRITSRRAMARGLASADQIASVAMWGVPFGVIGGRIYHVLTSLDSFRGRWVEVLYVWHGGLGIWGGVALGIAAGMWQARRLGLNAVGILDCAVPGIAVAQAIGRWGNWFNQELFGGPTTLPWALRVSATKVQEAGYAPGTTFHPTFLYESIGCLVIAWILVRVDATRRPTAGRLAMLYVALYTAIRFFIEGLRIDTAHHVAGMRLNQWVALVVFALAAGGLLLTRRRSSGPAEASTVNDHE